MELVIAAIERAITAAGAREKPEVMRFPPLISRHNLERSDYLRSFPNLAGSVHSFGGDVGDHARLLQHLDRNEDWSGCLEPTGVVLAPAACYAVYPVLTGTLPAGGRLVDVVAFVFRNEPSDDPTRLQVFRLREYVLAGDAGAVPPPLRTLGRPRDGAPALASGFQWRHRRRTIPSSGAPAACSPPTSATSNSRSNCSCRSAPRNSRRPVAPATITRIISARPSTFATPAGEPAHSACVGFGLERIALALFRHHGFRSGNWPEAVRRQLGL